MSVHLCVRFSNHPRLISTRAVRWIETYLASISTCIKLSDGGIHLSIHEFFYKPDKEKVIECYIDYDLSGGWSKVDANNAENFISHTGYIMMYVGFPVLFCFKIQIEIVLNRTEAE